MTRRKYGPQLPTIATAQWKEPSIVLNKKETLIASLLLKGYGNAKISALTGIGYQVVKNVKRAVYDKLGASSETELVAMARAQNALQLWLCDDITYRPTEEEKAWEDEKQRRERHEEAKKRILREYGHTNDVPKRSGTHVERAHSHGDHEPSPNPHDGDDRTRSDRSS